MKCNQKLKQRKNDLFRRIKEVYMENKLYVVKDVPQYSEDVSNYCYVVNYNTIYFKFNRKCSRN